MRVAYVTDTPRMGGAERHLLSLLRSGQRAGEEEIVLSPQRFLLDAVASEVPVAELIELGDEGDDTQTSQRRRALARLRQVRGLRSKLASSGAELLHVNNGGHPGSDLCRIAPLMARLAGIPRRVITINSMPRPREVLQPQVEAVADTVLWRSVEAVLCPARIVGERLSEMRGMPPSLFRYVPYGVEPPGGESEAPALRDRLLGNRRLLVGMVSATSDREKGHDVFVEALGRLEDVAGVVVGPDPPPPVIERLGELGLGDRLTLEGPHADVGVHYHAIDALVVPSTAYECLPFVVLEAMAAGKPVIASRLSGIPEAVEDGESGWLFAPGATDELVERIEFCLGSPEALEAAGRAGRGRWASRFSIESMYRAYVAALDGAPREFESVS